jgi:hypothetical protein
VVPGDNEGRFSGLATLVRALHPAPGALELGQHPAREDCRVDTELAGGSAAALDGPRRYLQVETDGDRAHDDPPAIELIACVLALLPRPAQERRLIDLVRRQDAL